MAFMFQVSVIVVEFMWALSFEI